MGNPWINRRGTRNVHAKLDPAKVRDIRARHRNGETQAELAARFNVSRPCIHYVLKRRTWAHVLEESF